MQVSDDVAELSKQVLKLVMENGLKNMRAALDNISNGMQAALPEPIIDLEHTRPRRVTTISPTFFDGSANDTANIPHRSTRITTTHINGKKADHKSKSKPKSKRKHSKPTLGERIKKFRTANNMSQSEFANRAGTYQFVISSAETGKHVPSTAAKRMIAYLKDQGV